ncbi:MAG: glycerate kinase, partial [Actinomycetota bacterium]|nr:glycerate kinase [Actinomycetota bacterium]
MRILLAPDKLKGTLSARHVAAAMASGARDVVRDAEVREHPMADGGEGSLDCLAAATGAALRRVAAEDAFGNPASARVLETDDSVIVEMSETAALPARPTPSSSLRASSRGTGMAMLGALSLAPGKRLVVCVGGTACTDGGAGAAQAAG